MSQEIAEKIRAAAQARGLDPELAVSIARAESSLNPSAKAAKSSASGLFQVTTDTWKQYKGAPGKQFDPDENIRVGMDIIADNMGSLRTALGREPRPAEVYAAHYFGPAGARSVLAAQPDTPIGDILSKRAIAANPNLKGKTVGAVLAQLEGKVGSSAVAAAPVAVQPDVSKPAVAPAAAAGEPGGRVVSRETGQEPAARLASLGPGYQAALALSFLADEDEKEERDLDRDPSISQQWLAQQASRPTGLALSDISIRSPFAAQEPVQPVRMNKGGEVKEPLLPEVSDYAATVAYEMYPGQQGQFTQQDAARHMLASGTLARKFGPTAAEMLGKLHEIKTSPLRWIGSKLGVSEMPVDYEQDLYNNQRGIEAGMRSRSQKELEDLIQSMVEQAREQNGERLTPQQIERMAGTPWIGKPQRPVKRAEGSPEEGERLTPQQIERIAQLEAKKREEAEKPAFLTPKSGIGRKISTKPGELELAAVQGMSELPYLLAGAPVDLATMAMRPFGYDVERPMLGSEDLKERALRAGIRQEPPKGEAARALYSMAELGASAVNPAAPVRGAVAAAQKTGEAAKMLARDFQQYNRQLDVPGASYAVRARGTPFMMSYGSTKGPDGRVLSTDQPEKYVRGEVATTVDPALNDWLLNRVTAYLRRDFATPDDQFVKAADANQLLHFVNKPMKRRDLDPYYERAENIGGIDSLPFVRQTEGFDPRGTAKTEYGKRVESLTDVSAWPVQLQDISSPGLIPPSMRDMAKTNPTARLTELGTNIDDTLQFNELAADMAKMRRMPKLYSVYSQPSVKVPEEYLLTDEALQGLTLAQASNRVAKFKKWEEETRQNMASRAFFEDPSIPRTPAGDGSVWVHPADLSKNRNMLRLVTDVGCDGGWCTKQQNYALDYGSGDNRLSILMDSKGRPQAQITLTTVSSDTDNFLLSMSDAETQAFKAAHPDVALYDAQAIRSTPEYDYWARNNVDQMSITEIKGVNNQSDIVGAPYVKQVQNEVKDLDSRFDLKDVDNLEGIGMVKVSNVYDLSLLGSNEKSFVMVRSLLKNKFGSEEAGLQALLNEAFRLNGGSKYFSVIDDDASNLFYKATGNLLGTEGRANGGMIERQSTDNRRYL